MSKKNVITRREAVSGSIAAAAGIVLAGAGSADAGCGSCGSGKKHTHKVAMPENKDFYDADGKFLPEKARQAYYDMYERFGGRLK
jgi:hypothetical protein